MSTGLQGRRPVKNAVRTPTGIVYMYKMHIYVHPSIPASRVGPPSSLQGGATLHPGCIHVYRTAFLTGRRPWSPVDWSGAHFLHLDGVQTTLSNDFLPSIFNHPFLFADYLAYSFTYPRMVNTQLRQDPERHFGLKKEGRCFIKI